MNTCNVSGYASNYTTNSAYGLVNSTGPIQGSTGGSITFSRSGYTNVSYSIWVNLQTLQGSQIRIDYNYASN